VVFFQCSLLSPAGIQADHTISIASSCFDKEARKHVSYKHLRSWQNQITDIPELDINVKIHY